MSNHARLFRITSMGALLVGTMLAPASAPAQLGKLKKAADAAKEKTNVKHDAPATPGSTSTNFVITADRLAAVMVAMDAAMERAATESAAKAVTADYNAKKKAYEACAEAQLKTVMGQAPSMAAMQKVAMEAQRTADLSKRMLAAQKANRYREVTALTDTMALGSSRSTLVMFGLETKCGAPAYMPAALLDESAAKMAGMNNGQSQNSRNEIIIPPAQRAGMSTQQFGMIRERAALWALQQTNNAPADNNKYSVFTTDENAVLAAQSAKLKKWAPIFKESPATWSNWGDIKSW